MRIATWNVNSLKARLDKVIWWLARAGPDVLLMQETKLADKDAPVDVFRAAGYELAHHGQGRWNGVAIASRVGIEEVVTNFGQPLRPDPTPDVADDVNVPLPPALVACGLRDEWFTREKMDRDLERARARGGRVESLEFDGGHEWTDRFLAAAGEFLRGLGPPW